MKKQSEKFDSILKKVVQHMVDADGSTSTTPLIVSGVYCP